jgi:hypothetical protein
MLFGTTPFLISLNTTTNMTIKHFYLFLILILIFNQCECPPPPPPPPPPCPFPLLSYRQIDFKEDELILDFSTEIGVEIQALKKSLGKGGGQIKTGQRISSIVKQYADRGLASDSVFVTYYNAYVSSACNRWYMYKDNPTVQNEKELQETLSAIDEFIANYNKNIDGLAFIDRLKSLQKELRSLSESVKASDRIDDISKRNYLRKITHMQNALSSVNAVEPTPKDIERFNEVELRFSSLRISFKQGRNF